MPQPGKQLQYTYRPISQSDDETWSANRIKQKHFS